MLADGQGRALPDAHLRGAATWRRPYPDNSTTSASSRCRATTRQDGLTVWTPAGVYIPKTTEGAKLDAAKKFLAFVASRKAATSQTRRRSRRARIVVKGCELPADVPPAVKDMQPYFDDGDGHAGAGVPVPVKGPALEQITVEVGSGIRSAADGAALYDEDVKKQAQQLGLPGW